MRPGIFSEVKGNGNGERCNSGRAVLLVESHGVGLALTLVFLLKRIEPAQRFVPVRFQRIGDEPMIRIAVQKAAAFELCATTAPTANPSTAVRPRFVVVSETASG